MIDVQVFKRVSYGAYYMPMKQNMKKKTYSISISARIVSIGSMDSITLLHNSRSQIFFFMEKKIWIMIVRNGQGVVDAKVRILVNPAVESCCWLIYAPENSRMLRISIVRKAKIVVKSLITRYGWHQCY